MSITTGAKAIDGLFRNGFPTCQVTEIAGPPGVGKTQFSMQMCVNVQLPITMGGADGEAVYIEGSFSVDRVAEMAESCIKRAFPNCTHDEHESKIDALLQKIHVYRVHDHLEQMALLNQMESVVERNPKVIDSPSVRL
ncbi:DNA repair protein rad51c [Podochytrium sp. JEL0797]|nr:DNA repair protein rad51c [Podochytrium sp. JEL0797]